MADFSIVVGSISIGPTGSTNGTGYYDGANNGGHACGSAAPTPARTSIYTVDCVGWVTGALLVIMAGAHPQNLFTSVALGAPASLSFNSSAASLFSTTLLPGYTLWQFTDSHQNAFIGQTFTVTFSGVVDTIPSPTGKGQLTNPKSWITVSTGQLPPAEYDGVPGNGKT